MEWFYVCNQNEIDFNFKSTIMLQKNDKKHPHRATILTHD